MNQTTALQMDIKPIVGQLEGFVEGRAVGWAYNPSKTDETISIELVCEEKVVGRGLAKNFRGDLVTAGLDQGMHAFDIPLSYELQNGKVHKLTARVENSKRPLIGGHKTFGPVECLHPFHLVEREEGLLFLKEELSGPTHKYFLSKIENFAQAYEYASILQECGDLSEALIGWKTIKEALKTSAICDCKTGETLLLQGQVLDANAAFESALIVDPEFTPALKGRGVTNWMLGNAELAKLDFEKALRNNSNDVECAKILAELRG